MFNVFGLRRFRATVQSRYILDTKTRGPFYLDATVNGQDDARADNARRTPVFVLDRVRELMGGIDLDPASDPGAQEQVRAGVWLGPGQTGSGRQDGLRFIWGGRVWLNPPGGKLNPETLSPIRGGPGISSAAVWWTKLVTEYQAGRISQACFLAFSLNVFRCGQVAGVPAPYTFPFLVFRDRIRFPASAGAKTESPNVDSALVYLPPRDPDQALVAKQKFALIFQELGQVRI